MDNNNQKNLIPVGDGNPYFMGDEALIKFSSGEEGYGKNTYWLVNKKDHTVRPFESHMALDEAFGEDLKEALENIIIVSQPTIDAEGEIQDGVLADFSILGPEFAIKDDGTAKPLHFSTHQLKSRFGKPINEKAEDEAVAALDRFLNTLKQYEAETEIPNDFIDRIREDSKLMAFYVSCIAYGKYTLKEIYEDIHKTFDNSKE